MYEDNNDLEAMLNNPLKSFSAGKSMLRHPGPPVEKPVPRSVRESEPLPDRTVDAGASRTERNHPSELRVLNLEKNGLITAKRLDDLKRIIEQQNERIQLLEEELGILRKELGKEGI